MCKYKTVDGSYGASVDVRTTEERFSLGYDSESFYPTTGGWANLFIAQRMFRQVVWAHPPKFKLDTKWVGTLREESK